MKYTCWLDGDVWSTSTIIKADSYSEAADIWTRRDKRAPSILDGRILNVLKVDMIHQFKLSLALVAKATGVEP